MAHDGALDAHDLLSNDGKNLKVYTIEFVKTSLRKSNSERRFGFENANKASIIAHPGTTTDESFEKFAHRQVIQAVAAVENNTVVCDCLC